MTGDWDEWSFWRAQLRGEEPETTPGTPWCGFYILKRRWTVDNTDPNRRPGDPRKKIQKAELPVAIWNVGTRWHCVVGKGDDVEYYTDKERIDEQIFARCCRNAITHEAYEELIRDEDK